MIPNVPFGLGWFVVEYSGDDPGAALVQGLQQAADRVHCLLCSCAGIRWIDCTDSNIKTDINRLFRASAWSLDQKAQPFCWRISFEDGYIKVVRVTNKVVRVTNKVVRVTNKVVRVTNSLPKELLRAESDHAALHFTVPLLPPSVNHYKLPNQKGGYRISKDAQAFMDAIPIFARPAAPEKWPWNVEPTAPAPFYEVDLIFYIHRPAFLKGDSDNLEKVAFDALTRCGAITDDRYIKFHTNRAIPVKEKTDERTEYIVRIVEGPEK